MLDRRNFRNQGRYGLVINPFLKVEESLKEVIKSLLKLINIGEQQLFVRMNLSDLLVH